MAKNGVPNVKREKSATKALKKALELYPTVKDGVATSTLATYGQQLKAFYKYCEEIKRDSIRMLTFQGLNDFEIYLREKGESVTKIRSSLRIVRILINKVMCKHPYFRTYGVNQVNVSLPANVSSEDLKVELLDEEIEALKNCQSLTPIQEEYRDLFLLELYTGQRASDLHIRAPAVVASRRAPVALCRVGVCHRQLHLLLLCRIGTPECGGPSAIECG